VPQPDETQPVKPTNTASAGETDTVSLPSPGPPARATTFSINEIIAGRFRIVRFLGRGGMGEVFEAEDLELREHVALKTVRPEIATDTHAIGRFRQEIQLARRVTHQNVCRIFDLFHHGNITFLTMELLQGETLAQRLRRQGRMDSTEALPIVRQMVAALAAAHAVGIVHRDFKTGNVMLIGAQGQEVRAVVTDFGLARSKQSHSEGESGATVGLVGTPAYMAPEQLEGGDITPSVDIYALGLVIYEMITGAQPFAGDSPLASAVKRLQQPPPTPRKIVPGLDPIWDAVVMRCLERSPGDRFAAVGDAAKLLLGESVAPGVRPGHRWLLWNVLAFLLVITLVLGYTMRVVRKPASAPLKPRRSVAVLGFKNVSGRADAAWISTALSEMLSTDLAAGERLRTIPGESVARTRIELSLPEAETLANDTLAKIRRNLGTDLVVLGSYLVLGEGPAGQIRLDLRVQDTVAGEIIAAVAESGAQENLFQLISAGGVRLRQRLGLGELSSSQAGGVRASLPAGPAARWYAEGLAKLRSFDTLAARDLLQKAVAADPNHPLARSALAAAWSSLGYDGKAREEARRAFDLSGNLPREERLSVEGRYGEAMKDWPKTAETYRTLFNFFPDNLDYGLRLSAAQTAAGKGSEALLTLEALRKLVPDDARIDLEEASTANSLSDFRRTQVAAARAAQKGVAGGAQLLLANARILEARAWWELSEPAKSLSAAEEAKRIYQAMGDRSGVALSLNNIANVLSSQKDLAGAKKMHEEALAIYRQVGNKKGMASALNNVAISFKDQGDLERAKSAQMESLAVRREIGDKSGVAVSLSNLATVFLDQGDLDVARKMYEESLAICREIGEKRGAVRAMLNLAVVLKDQGELASAKPMLQESLAIRRQIGDKRGSAIALFNIALVLSLQGDLSGARKTYEEALAINREIGDQRGIAYALFGLGEIFKAQGDLTGARKYFEDALAMRDQRGEKATAAETRLSLAELAIDEERHETAEELARSAAQEFRHEKADFAAAQAHLCLSRSLLVRGKVREAQKEIDRAAALLKKNTNLYARLSFGIAAARAGAALGRRDEALRSLEAIRGETGKAGLVGYQLEAGLAMARIEKSASRLAAIENEAIAKGYRLIARQAAVARK
jgi:eukaryotic-like serine/threonine-protein kinase